MAKFILPLFEHSPLLALPIFALLLFMVTFVVVTVRALRQAPTEVDAMARAPLDDGLPGGTEPLPAHAHEKGGDQ